MSVNTRHVNASPQDVFDVLTDALAYGRWVVGPTKVVSVDASWPAVGSAFVHQHGRGPLKIRDETSVNALEPPRRITLNFNIRPLGMQGLVDFRLDPDEGGTRVVMEETVTGGYLAPIWNPAFDRIMWARNLQGLQRLKDLVERRSARPDSSPEAPPTDRHPAAVAGGAATGLLFWGLSNLRGASVFHPVGSVREAELVIHEGQDVGSAFVDEPGRYQALARLSRGIGLPHPLPDILGLAIKVPDRYGSGADQDLLLASSGQSVVGRRTLRVRRRPQGWFSTILGFEAGGRTILFGARCRSADAATFGLFFAEPSGPWREFGELRVGPAVERDAMFDPWHTGPDLVPTGALNELRAPAYQGSRRGRAEAAA